MRTISRRELRNDDAEIMRGVEAGESFTVTRRGVPVARLVPIAHEPDLSLGPSCEEAAAVRRPAAGPGRDLDCWLAGRPARRPLSRWYVDASAALRLLISVGAPA
ncbi:MAG TPA: type II toxin-antitoxin system prevent-host-death family antitoxin [Marmoricola sp.]|nr:type II toxin-antitoxin system prevent-host-death family antitoxin [Marmoricola sp.]